MTFLRSADVRWRKVSRTGQLLIDRAVRADLEEFLLRLVDDSRTITTAEAFLNSGDFFHYLIEPVRLDAGTLFELSPVAGDPFGRMVRA